MYIPGVTNVCYITGNFTCKTHEQLASESFSCLSIQHALAQGARKQCRNAQTPCGKLTPNTHLSVTAMRIEMRTRIIHLWNTGFTIKKINRLVEDILTPQTHIVRKHGRNLPRAPRQWTTEYGAYSRTLVFHMRVIFVCLLLISCIYMSSYLCKYSLRKVG